MEKNIGNNILKEEIERKNSDFISEKRKSMKLSPQFPTTPSQKSSNIHGTSQKRRSTSFKKPQKIKPLCLTMSENDFHKINDRIKNKISSMKKLCQLELRKMTDDTDEENLDNIVKGYSKRSPSYIKKVETNYTIKEVTEENNKNNFVNITNRDEATNENNIARSFRLAKIDSSIPNNIQKEITFKEQFFSDDNNIRKNSKLSKTVILKKESTKKEMNKINKIKDNRILIRKKRIIDSNEDDDEEEINAICINPESRIILIFDGVLFVCAFYALVYFPVSIAKNDCMTCYEVNNSYESTIYTFIDFIYIIDFIISFYRGYYSPQENKLIKNKNKIIFHYLLGWFLLDLISAIPINTINNFKCKKQSTINKCYKYYASKGIFIFASFKLFKVIKTLKLTSNKNNQFLNYIYNTIIERFLLDQFMDIIYIIFLSFFVLHLISCLFIFMGNHSYPNWIFKNNFQEYSFSSLYVTSLYFIIATITTVGYGDIGVSNVQQSYVLFHIILLIGGIFVYSYIVSSIGNIVQKQSNSSIKYENELKILEEIRQENPNLSYEVYINIKKHLDQKFNLQLKNNKNFLFSNIPYFLRNNLLFSMYQKQIDSYKFFKGTSNSNFLAETLLLFNLEKPNNKEILIKENELIEKVYFVNKGKLSLELLLYQDNILATKNLYLSEDFMNFETDDIQNIKQSTTLLPNKSGSQKKISSILSSSSKLLNTIFNPKISDKTIAVYTKTDFNETYINIHDIYEGEHYGGLFIQLNWRSPFALQVKSKNVELYSIKRSGFYFLMKEFPNIIKRINSIAKTNMIVLKTKVQNLVTKLSEEDFKRRKNHTNIKNTSTSAEIVENKLILDKLENKKPCLTALILGQFRNKSIVKKRGRRFSVMLESKKTETHRKTYKKYNTSKTAANENNKNKINMSSMETIRKKPNFKYVSSFDKCKSKASSKVQKGKNSNYFYLKSISSIEGNERKNANYISAIDGREQHSFNLENHLIKKKNLSPILLNKKIPIPSKKNVRSNFCNSPKESVKQKNETSNYTSDNNLDKRSFLTKSYKILGDNSLIENDTQTITSDFYYSSSGSLEYEISPMIVESFCIKQSYPNLNKVSHGFYLKDRQMQKKLSKYIKKKYKEEEEILECYNNIMNEYSQIHKNENSYSSYKSNQNNSNIAYKDQSLSEFNKNKNNNNKKIKKLKSNENDSSLEVSNIKNVNNNNNISYSISSINNSNLNINSSNSINQILSRKTAEKVKNLSKNNFLRSILNIIFSKKRKEKEYKDANKTDKKLTSIKLNHDSSITEKITQNAMIECKERVKNYFINKKG